MEPIGKHISRIYRRQSIIVNERVKHLGLGHGQYLFLINLSKHEGINQKDLSDYLKIDRANTTRAIKRLIEQELVHSEVDENDKRNHRLYLTDKGKNTAKLLRYELDGIMDIMRQGISDEDLEVLYRIFSILEENVEGEVERIRQGRENE